MEQGNKQPERPWLLRLTEEQYNSIMFGMEIYHRLLCGETDVLDWISNYKIDDDLLDKLKSEMFPDLHPNGYWSWDGSGKGDYFDLEMARGYQIYREMLHQVEIRKPYDNLGNVYRSETLQTDKADRLIVERINK